MKSLAGQTVKCYGYDTTGLINYSFDSEGFRKSELDDASKPGLVVIGNSLSFGVGIPVEHTYGYMLAQYTDRRLYNRAVGCVLHENHDYLATIKSLTQQDPTSTFVIQINNLSRCRTGDVVSIVDDRKKCVDRFIDFFNQSEELLNGFNHKYIYWDDIQYDLPKLIQEKITINNKFHLDQSLPDRNITFGPKSHATIAKVLHHCI